MLFVRENKRNRLNYTGTHWLLYTTGANGFYFVAKIRDPNCRPSAFQNSETPNFGALALRQSETRAFGISGLQQPEMAIIGTSAFRLSKMPISDNRKHTCKQKSTTVLLLAI